MGSALHCFMDSSVTKTIRGIIHLNPTWFLLSPPVIGKGEASGLSYPLVEPRVEGLNVLCV